MVLHLPGSGHPLEVEMATVKKAKTRLARWINTLRKVRYYDGFE
jgi:hypothetical protein